MKDQIKAIEAILGSKRKPVTRHKWTLEDDLKAVDLYLGVIPWWVPNGSTNASMSLKQANIDAIVKGKGLTHVSRQLIDACKQKGLIK